MCPILFLPAPFRAVKAEPAYASARAHVGERGNIKVATEAHRVLPGGSLSGYDLSSTRPRNNVERTDSEVDPRADEGAEAAGMRVDDAVFVDAALSPRVDGPGGWRGTVSVEELPGGGLHRHVRMPATMFRTVTRCRDRMRSTLAPTENYGGDWAVGAICALLDMVRPTTLARST